MVSGVKSWRAWRSVRKGENDREKQGLRGKKKNRWQLKKKGEKKRDGGDDKEFEKVKRWSQDSLHSLRIRAAIGQHHDTHLCRERMSAVMQAVKHLGAYLASNRHLNTHTGWFVL